MRRSVHPILVAGAVIAAVGWLSPAVSARGFASIRQGPIAFDSAARLASMIFEGVVIRRDSVASPSGTHALPVAVVEVGQILRASPSLGPISGQKVRVVMNTPDDSVNTHAVFLTAGAGVGRDLTVKQIMRVRVSTLDDVRSVRAQLAKADSANAERDIASRARSAKGVVLGLIESTTVVPMPDTLERLRSEHAPEWMQVRMSITSVARGADSSFLGRHIWVYFAPDGERESGLKFESGQRRILFLQQVSTLPRSYRVGLDTLNHYVVVRQNDALRASDSALVWRVVK